VAGSLACCAQQPMAQKPDEHGPAGGRTSTEDPVRGRAGILSVRGRARASQAGPPLAMRRRWHWVHGALWPALAAGRACACGPALAHPWLLLHHSVPPGQQREVLLPKLPERLSEEQERAKVHNLMQELRRSGRIERQGSRAEAAWILKARAPAGGNQGG
jgi:hypothetical protein